MEEPGHVMRGSVRKGVSVRGRAGAGSVRESCRRVRMMMMRILRMRTMRTMTKSRRVGGV